MSRPFDENIASVIEDIFNYIENDDDFRLTLGELEDVVKDYVPSDPTIG